MATAIGVARKRESRPACVAERLPMICQLAGCDDQTNTADMLRLQRLRLVGIVGARAACLAELAWGGRRNG